MLSVTRALGKSTQHLLAEPHGLSGNRPITAHQRVDRNTAGAKRHDSSRTPAFLFSAMRPGLAARKGCCKRLRSNVLRFIPFATEPTSACAAPSGRACSAKLLAKNSGPRPPPRPALHSPAKRENVARSGITDTVCAALVSEQSRNDRCSRKIFVGLLHVDGPNFVLPRTCARSRWQCMLAPSPGLGTGRNTISSSSNCFVPLGSVTIAGLPKSLPTAPEDPRLSSSRRHYKTEKPSALSISKTEDSLSFRPVLPPFIAVRAAPLPAWMGIPSSCLGGGVFILERGPRQVFSPPTFFTRRAWLQPHPHRVLLPLREILGSVSSFRRRGPGNDRRGLEAVCPDAAARSPSGSGHHTLAA